MAEEILISIEIEKGENEKQVDVLTKKILALKQANQDLNKQNIELAKTGQQNSQQYIENTRQIEINKQKITEATSSRKNLIATIVSEDNSIKALKVRNAELIKQRDVLSTATAEGKKKIAEINAEINKNNDIIKENVSQQEKQRLGVGGYVEALDKLVPGLGATVTGIQNATKAALVFMATPLGLVLAALGAALFALTSYFKGSEEGQNNLNKVVAVGSAIFEQFMNVVEAVGKAIFDAISNPKQALIDFGNLLQENIINRLEGMLEFIPQIGRAIGLLFKGEFSEAGKVAFDAVAKVTTGVENATDKIAGFIEETGKLVEQGIIYGQKLAAVQAKIDLDERKLIVDRNKTALEVAKLRAEALEVEGEERKRILLEAIALEESLAARETALAKTRLTQAILLRDANGDDKEALDNVAKARAAVFAAEATAFENTLRFRKQIAALDEADAAAALKKEEEAEKIEIDRFKRRQEALKELERLELEQQVINAENIQARIDKEVELETLKTLQLLENAELLESERQLILEKGQANINAIIAKGAKDQLAADQKLAAEKNKIREQEKKSQQSAVDAGMSLLREAFGEAREVAAAGAAISTYRAAAAALEPPPVGFGPIFGPILSALTIARGFLQVSKILGIKFFKGGLLQVKKMFGFGGIANTGAILKGPLHTNGGIPFTVGGRPGFEAEGGEALINRRSTAMFKDELSAINQAGGGVAFGRGGVPRRYQTGSVIAGTQTRQASQVAEGRAAMRDAMQSIMNAMPPFIVTVQDINERQTEVSDQSQRAIVA
jgi:hypothetical protein